MTFVGNFGREEEKKIMTRKKSDLERKVEREREREKIEREKIERRERREREREREQTS